MKLKQRFVLLCVIGLAAGVISGSWFSALIGTLSANDGTLKAVSDELVRAVGDPFAAFTIQMIAGGLYGIVTIGGTIVYNLEKWGILKATVVHYLIVMIGYFVLALSLRWFTLEDLDFLLIFFIFMTIGYVWIWLIMYLISRAQVKKINKELDEFKHVPFEEVK